MKKLSHFVGEFIVGRVIKAMMASWHPKCFTCEMCHKELADLGFIKNQGKKNKRNIYIFLHNSFDVFRSFMRSFGKCVGYLAFSSNL